MIMPVNKMGQYIGAKVTPSFFENPIDGSNEWVAGITYEELTVITYDGKLFISKKPVFDITVEPTNTEYWLEYPSNDSTSIQIYPISNDTVSFQLDRATLSDGNILALKIDSLCFLIVNITFTTTGQISGSSSILTIQENIETLLNTSIRHGVIATTPILTVGAESKTVGANYITGIDIEPTSIYVRLPNAQSLSANTGYNMNCVCLLPLKEV